MVHRTFDTFRVDKLERVEQRYRFLSAEELLSELHVDVGNGDRTAKSPYCLRYRRPTSSKPTTPSVVF